MLPSKLIIPPREADTYRAVYILREQVGFYLGGRCIATFPGTALNEMRLLTGIGVLFRGWLTDVIPPADVIKHCEGVAKNIPLET